MFAVQNVEMASREDPTRPRGYKTVFILNSAEYEIYKFILLINVKMPTIVGILTFISRINDWLL